MHQSCAVVMCIWQLLFFSIAKMWTFQCTFVFASFFSLFTNKAISFYFKYGALALTFSFYSSKMVNAQRENCQHSIGSKAMFMYFMCITNFIFQNSHANIAYERYILLLFAASQLFKKQTKTSCTSSQH